MIRSGSASSLVHSRAWVSNSPLGSRIKTQRSGTAGKPLLYQSAVAEATSTLRSPSPYQSAIVIGIQAVFGSSATAESLGRREPFTRGLPSCPRRRGGAGS
jgi:hypothetical protein